MAITISVVRRTVVGNLRVVVADITFDNSYPTGGYAFTASSVGLTSLDLVLHKTTVGGYLVEYDYVGGAFLVRRADLSHRHVLHFQTVAAANATTAAASQLRTAAAAFDVAGVPDSTAEGGVVDNALPAVNAQNGLGQLGNTSNVLNALVLRCVIIGI